MGSTLQANSTSSVVPVTLPNGSKIHIATRSFDGAGKREKVGIKDLAF